MIWSSPRMREDDGRKLDHKTLEQLRIRAVGQIQQGAHPEDVAAALGMTRAAVHGWLAKYREGGLEALKARPVPGRPSKLQGPQLAQLYGLVVGMILASCSLPYGPGRCSASSSAASSAWRCRGSAWPAAAHAGDVAPAVAVPRLPAEPAGGGALQGRDLLLPGVRREHVGVVAGEH